MTYPGHTLVEESEKSSVLAFSWLTCLRGCWREEVLLPGETYFVTRTEFATLTSDDPDVDTLSCTTL